MGHLTDKGVFKDLRAEREKGTEKDLTFCFAS
jgi:hypothetical protein